MRNTIHGTAQGYTALSCTVLFTPLKERYTHKNTPQFTAAPYPPSISIFFPKESICNYLTLSHYFVRSFVSFSLVMVSGRPKDYDASSCDLNIEKNVIHECN